MGTPIRTGSLITEYGKKIHPLLGSFLSVKKLSVFSGLFLDQRVSFYSEDSGSIHHPTNIFIEIKGLLCQVT